MKLFDRVINVKIGAVEIGHKIEAINRAGDLRITFKVTKTLKKEPNEIEVDIYNLSADTRKRIDQVGTDIVLHGGHVGHAGLFAAGFVKQVFHQLVGPDWVTKVIGEDNGGFFGSSKINKSYRKGTRTFTMIEDMLSGIGIKKGNLIPKLSSIPPQQKTKTTTSFNGRTIDAVEYLMSDLDLDLSIQDGSLQALKKGDKDSIPTLIPALGADWGLIGSLDMGQSEKKLGLLKGKCLLMHELRPGGQVAIESVSLKPGTQIRLERIEHSGDTYGQDWYTEFEGKIV